jgi:hypothetical protein
MEPGEAPVCLVCFWYWPAPAGTLADAAVRKLPRCRAFPAGIPLLIWEGGNKHRDEVAGDNGVRFRRLKPDEQRDPRPAKVPLTTEPPDAPDIPPFQ